MLDAFSEDAKSADYTGMSAALGSDDRIAAAARTALYGDKSDSDIRAEIAVKYPAGDEMTLRDFYNMTWEMEQVGVDGGMRDVLENATNFFEHIVRPPDVTVTVADRTRLRESLMDQKLDTGFLSNAYNKLLKSGEITDDAGKLLQEHLGISIDENGKASTSESNSTNWFESIVDWLSNDDIVANANRREAEFNAIIENSSLRSESEQSIRIN